MRDWSPPRTPTLVPPPLFSIASMPVLSGSSRIDTEVRRSKDVGSIKRESPAASFVPLRTRSTLAESFDQPRSSAISAANATSMRSRPQSITLRERRPAAHLSRDVLNVNDRSIPTVPRNILQYQRPRNATYAEILSAARNLSAPLYHRVGDFDEDPLAVHGSRQVEHLTTDSRGQCHDRLVQFAGHRAPELRGPRSMPHLYHSPAGHVKIADDDVRTNIPSANTADLYITRSEPHEPVHASVPARLSFRKRLAELFQTGVRAPARALKRVVTTHDRDSSKQTQPSLTRRQ
nr:hypothetical protein CFP56_69042 [Quercus suber]